VSSSPAQEAAVGAAAPAQLTPSGGAVPALPPAAPEPVCENCAAPVTGPYCAQCGQKHGHSVHSVWHFIREITENLTHSDSRLWITLVALLSRPGALTREFLDGHRVRYMPPLRLYLVISLAFFLLEALTPHQASVLQVQINPGGVDKGFQVSQTPLTGVEAGHEPMTPQRAAEICQNILKNAPSFLSRFHLEQSVFNSCQKSYSDGGASFKEAFLHNWERGMFLFLPLLAAFTWLLYWRPRRYYVEHLLFFLHNHSFLFLILALNRLMEMVMPLASLRGLLSLLILGYVVWYLYRSMRRVYGQGRLLTLAKYATLVLVYFLTSVLGLTITAAYSWLTF
jgi:hypothetical protein